MSDFKWWRRLRGGAWIYLRGSWNKVATDKLIHFDNLKDSGFNMEDYRK